MPVLQRSSVVALDPPELLNAQGSRVEIRAIAWESGEPVAGAVVSIDEHQPHFGAAPVVTDEAGVAFLRLGPIDSSHPVLSVRHGTLYGELWNRAGDVEEEVRTVFLHPDAGVVVRVTTADGQVVAGELVALQVRCWPAGRPFLLSSSVLTKPTDANGEAVFAHVQTCFRRRAPDAELGSDLIATLPGLGVTSGQLPLHGGAQRIALVRPATSGVNVQVKEVDATPLDGLVCRVRETVGDDPLLAGPDVVMQAGRASVASLLPGVRYRLELIQVERVLVQQDFVAPPAGTAIDVVLQLHHLRVVTAQIVDERNRAITDTSLMFSVQRGTETLHYPCKSDRAGRVAVWIDPQGLPGTTCRWRIAQGWPDPRAGMRSAPFSLDARQTASDLFPSTELSHHGMALVAKGRVVDDRGQALDVNQLLAQRVRGASGRLDVCFVPTETGGPGEFRALGDVEDHEFVICAFLRDGGVANAVCRKGDDDCLVVYTRSCSVTAFIDGPNAGSLQLLLRKRDDRGQGSAPSSASPESADANELRAPSPQSASAFTPMHVRAGVRGSSFVWRRLKSGIYDLEIRPVGQQEACLDIRGIVVEPGDCKDERLRHISVQSLAREVRVQLLTPGGAKPGGRLHGVVLVGSRGSLEPLQVVPVVARDSQFSFFTALASVDIRVCLDGYQPIDLPPDSFDVVVELAARPSVELSVRAPGLGENVTRSRYRLRATRVGVAIRGVASTESEVEVDVDGRRSWLELELGHRYSLQLPSLGTYALELEELRGWEEGVPVDAFSPNRLVVESAQDRVELVIRGSGR